jgi:hypothetical protein
LFEKSSCDLPITSQVHSTLHGVALNVDNKAGDPHAKFCATNYKIYTQLFDFPGAKKDFSAKYVTEIVLKLPVRAVGLLSPKMHVHLLYGMCQLLSLLCVYFLLAFRLDSAPC